MREIKFRLFDKNENAIVSHEELVFQDQETTCVYSILTRNESLEYNNLIRMQYTGLKDRNGREIYEADACRAWGEEPYISDVISTDYDWEIRGFVIHKEGCFWINVDNEHNIWIPLSDHIYGDGQIEVIGNIYDNPGLINSDWKRSKSGT